MLRPEDIASLRRVFSLCEAEAVLSVEQLKTDADAFQKSRMETPIKRNLHEAQTRLNILQEAADVLKHLDWWNYGESTPGESTPGDQ